MCSKPESAEVLWLINSSRPEAIFRHCKLNGWSNRRSGCLVKDLNCIFGLLISSSKIFVKFTSGGVQK